MIVNVQTPGDLAAEDAAKAADALAARTPSPAVTGLSAYVNRCWQAAKDAKRPVETRMLDAMRRRKGEYSTAELNDFARSGSAQIIFLNITDEKCNAALSWISDLIFGSTEQPWSVSPTTIPDLPLALKQQIAMGVAQEAMQDQQAGLPVTPDIIRAKAAQAKEKALIAMRQRAKTENGRAEQKIQDVLDEGNWLAAMMQAIDNMTTFPAGILKGPIYKSVPQRRWGDGGTSYVEDTLTITWEAPSPLDIFPAPLAQDTNDSYLIERHTLTRRDLQGMRVLPGYDVEAINRVLERYGDGGLDDWLDSERGTERRDLEGKERGDEDPEGKIVALQFWGWVQGKMLIEWGMDETQFPDPLDDYAAEVWWIGQEVIKAELNGDDLGLRPYHKACFRDVPGSFWGKSLVEIIAPEQDLANSAARALVNNMGIASGPQIAIDANRLPEGEKVTDIYPWKVWQFDMSKSASVSQPLWSIEFPSRATELWGIYQSAAQEADNRCGIPRYMQGENQKTGAAGTASGMSMLLQSAAKGVKKVVAAIDAGFIEPGIQRLFEMLVKSQEIEGYQGDIKIIARGSKTLVAKDQAMVRRNEFLQFLFKLPPEIQKELGLPFFMDVLRAQVRDLAIGAEDEIPDGNEIREREARNQLLASLQAERAAAAGMLPPGQTGQPGATALPQQQPAPRALMADGAPAGGTDSALFQRGPQ